MSEQEVNKTIQLKLESNVEYPAVRVPVRKDILAEAADWELQFVMTAPEYNQTKERRFPGETWGGGTGQDYRGHWTGLEGAFQEKPGEEILHCVQMVWSGSHQPKL